MNKREGFWKSSLEPHLPEPKPEVLNPKQAFELYDIITKLEKIAKKTTYRGVSHSRITGEKLGCAEYTFSDWSWPGDFAKHYVLEYRVKPSDDFLEFLGVKI